MWCKVMITVILLICGFAVSLCCKFFAKLDKDTRFRQNFLMGRWKRARDERMRWKNDHQWASFDDPEYQRLWEIEIGAEDLYLLSMMSWPRINGYDTSWHDYCYEQDQAEQETSW